jgi:dihydrodipicolinate synthase/N-acetylneuraminate lyase
MSVDRDSVRWTGYIPAVTTPFAGDGGLDLDAFAEQMGWFADQRLSGVILAGTTGEWFSLTETERATLFVEGAKNAADGMWVLGGCNAFTQGEAIRHARAAQAAGLDGILVTPPPYVVPTRREVVRFYQDISAATDIPICVYNWPRGCVVDLDTDLLAQLAGIDHVVAIKNSTGDVGRFLAGLYALGDTVRYFNVPTNQLGADLVGLGRGDGLMGSGAPLGRDHADFWRALHAGDRRRALEVGARDRLLMRRWFTAGYAPRFGNTPAIMKTALRLRGVPAGFVRAPLLDLTEPEVRIVRATLRELDIDTVELS